MLAVKATRLRNGGKSDEGRDPRGTSGRTGQRSRRTTVSPNVGTMLPYMVSGPDRDLDPAQICASI